MAFQTGQLRRAAQAGFVGKALRAFPRRLSGGKMMYCPCSVDEEGRGVGEPRQFVQRVPYPRHDHHEPGPAVLRIAGQGFGVEHGGVRSVFGKAVEQAPPAGRFSGGRDEWSQVFQFLPIDRAVVGAEQPRFAPVSRRDAEHGKIRDERARERLLIGIFGTKAVEAASGKDLADLRAQGAHPDGTAQRRKLLSDVEKTAQAERAHVVHSRKIENHVAHVLSDKLGAELFESRTRKGVPAS